MQHDSLTLAFAGGSGGLWALLLFLLLVPILLRAKYGTEKERAGRIFFPLAIDFKLVLAYTVIFFSPRLFGVKYQLWAVEMICALLACLLLIAILQPGAITIDNEGIHENLVFSKRFLAWTDVRNASSVNAAGSVNAASYVESLDTRIRFSPFLLGEDRFLAEVEDRRPK